MNNKIYVAKLGKTVGLDGSMKIYLDTDFPEQFKKGAKFTTNKGIPLVIKAIDLSRNIVKFEDIPTVEDAKKLTNQELFTTIEQTRELCTLDENQFFWFDLIDCKVVENDNILGVVKDIQRLPSSDYFEVLTSSDFIEKGFSKTFLIPYIKLYVISIDITSKTIYTKNCFDILENS